MGLSCQPSFQPRLRSRLGAEAPKSAEGLGFRAIGDGLGVSGIEDTAAFGLPPFVSCPLRLRRGRLSRRARDQVCGVSGEQTSPTGANGSLGAPVVRRASMMWPGGRGQFLLVADSLYQQVSSSASELRSSRCTQQLKPKSEKKHPSPLR